MGTVDNMDIVVPGNGQLQWSIIGSDMPSALGLVLYRLPLPQYLHGVVGEYGVEVVSQSGSHWFTYISRAHNYVHRHTRISRACACGRGL